jgi:hypothetical protein
VSDEAEDKDGFEDDDGCPDLDNDKDGILDANDLCPDKPEDLDGFEDSDGCPELDNDGDGVVDSLDKCPGVKGLPTNDGCPKTQEIQRGKLILAGVTFMSGKAVLNVIPTPFWIRCMNSCRVERGKTGKFRDIPTVRVVRLPI